MTAGFACARRVEVEARHHNLPVGVEHDLGRFGVREDVELGRRGRVAAGGRAAHDRERGDQAGDAGVALERLRDIRERTGRDEVDRARLGADEIEDQLDRVPVVQ